MGELLETLSMELELTNVQIDSLQRRKVGQKQTISSDREAVVQCFELVEQLRKRLAAHIEASQSITNQIRHILTPTQVAKFLMWVEKERSTGLLDTFKRTEWDFQ